MTYKEFFYSEYLLQCFLEFLSYVAEAFSMLNIILISTCFLGSDAKIKKKTFLFPGILSLIGIVSGLGRFIIGWRELASHANDIYTAVPLSENVTSLIAIVTYAFIIIMTILIAWSVYDKKRILKCLGTVIALILTESYIQFILTDSYAFITGDIKLVYDSYGYAITYTPFHTFYMVSYAAVQFILFSTLYFGLYKKQRFIYIAWRYRLVFVFWVLLMAFVPVPLIDSTTNMSLEVRYMELTFGVALVLLGLVIPFIIAMLVSRGNAIEKTKIQEKYIEAELEYINQYKKKQNETRAFRHDIINNLSLLDAMLKDGKTDDAKEHLDELLGAVKEMSPKYITGDEMLDCIVGMKASSMDEKGIDFEIDGVIDGGLDMKPVDVCNIFANAFDNAIEACEKLPETNNRWVKLLVKKTDNFLDIVLTNSTLFKKNGIPADQLFEGVGRKTSKKDKNLHGFGIQNMMSSLEKYEGMLKANEEDNVFTLSILIPR